MSLQERQLRKYSEVAVMKSVKNHTELQGFRNCHVRILIKLRPNFEILRHKVKIFNI